MGVGGAQRSRLYMIVAELLNYDVRISLSCCTIFGSGAPRTFSILYARNYLSLSAPIFKLSMAVLAGLIPTGPMCGITYSLT